MPSVAPSAVVAGDTYSIEVVGFNTSEPTDDIYLILPTLTPTFGTTTTYASDALGGQTLTVTSSETTTGGVTTGTFSFSVPTNFVPSGTQDSGGMALNAIQFSFGDYLGGTNPLDLTKAATGFSATSTVTFKLNGVTTSLSAPASFMGNGTTQFSAFGQTTSPAGTDISNNQVTGLTITITNAVPEPSTSAAVLLGAAGLCWLTVKRRRVRA